MEPQKQNFNPKNYLINTEKLQQLECIICTEKTLKMMQCKNCKKTLCNQCAVDQKIKNNKCPLRCTNEALQIELVPDLDLFFRCPFSNECKTVLKSMKEFHQHGRKCQFIGASQREEEGNKWKFACGKGHGLEVRVDAFEQLIKREKCNSCGECGIMRAMCRKCDEFYCNYCRPLPIHNLKCPIGHKFIKRDVKTISYRCDICELPPAILGLDLYDDFICNYGLCGLCIENWPTFQQPVQYCANERNCCELVGRELIEGKLGCQQLGLLMKEHTLEILSEQVKTKCALCEKEKACYKKCSKCNTYYCFTCKRFQVFQNLECEFGHAFKRLEPIESQQSEEPPKLCRSCNSKSPAQKQVHHQFWSDKECNVTLCKVCLLEHIAYNFDVFYKYLSLDLGACVESPTHPLFYLPAGRDFEAQCWGCKENRKIKFNCSMCESPRLYCCRCIPSLDLNKCYCGKVLAQNPPLEDQCCVCGQIGQCLICKPCKYSICQECRDPDKPGQPAMQQAQ